MPTLGESIASALKSATKDFTAKKRHETHERKMHSSDYGRWRIGRTEAYIKELAEEVMEQAVAEASGNGKYAANARQVMYAARRLILQKNPHARIWRNSSYFTQTLLPDWADEHGVDIAFGDRGHFAEPHTDTLIGIGTVAVNEYVGKWISGEPVLPDVESIFGEVEAVATKGPTNRYSCVVFIEKEGFADQLEQAKVAERFDVAIMSTKGYSTTAARRLVDNLSHEDVTVLVAHDFDVDGLGIEATLRLDTRRYQPTGDNTVDIGLRLDDVRRMGLAGESHSPRGRDWAFRLSEYGASDAEIAFLRTKRVELNEMSAPQFISWLEGKLKANGVEKVVPDAATLAEAYRRAAVLRPVMEAAEEALGEKSEKVHVPVSLDKRVRAMLKKEPTIAWDAAVWRLAQGSSDGDA